MHTLEKRAEAIGAYVFTGSLTLAAKQSGVHRDTLARWVNEPEAQSMLAELRSAHASGLADLAAAVAREAIERARERLADPRISARDAAVTAGIMIDKVSVLREQSTHAAFTDFSEISHENLDRHNRELLAITAELERRKREKSTACAPVSGGDLH